MVRSRASKNIPRILKIHCSFRDILKTKKISGFPLYTNIVLFDCGYVLLGYTKYDVPSKNQAHLMFSQL